MLTGKYLDLYNSLTGKIDKRRIYRDPLNRLAFGADASLYRLIPQMVIRTKDEYEICLILRECSLKKIPVTFRASGTSLSGQAVTDSVLLLAKDQWKKYTILEDGLKIRVEPGLTGAEINALLAPYGRKIGPDPASIKAASIGGIIANNACGMSSGTDKNAFSTIENLRIIFADGTILDTGDQSSRDSFMKSKPGLVREILSLASSVRENKPLADRIKHKYLIKNTTGYSLNALTVFHDPVEIIKHLLIGSEGTLGFISGVTLNTVPEPPLRATSFMIFPDIRSACKAVEKLKENKVSAIELIDRSGMRAVEDEAGMPEILKILPEAACSLLVETYGQTKTELDENIGSALKAVSDFRLAFPAIFIDDLSEYEVYWNIRKGLFPSVGASRSVNTTVVIEDVAFPGPKLADAVSDLRSVLDKYGYSDAVIYGHALDGNVHFIFSQDFGNDAGIQKYHDLMSEVSDLVVNRYDGSLKAEHGTGRNMAPFVELEWGKDAYEVMRMIKRIFDPDNLLNPGVILNSDPLIHLKNLKHLAETNEIVDKCIECGFCEPSCVSADLTFSPRQRIVAYREISRLIKSGEEPHYTASLVRSFSYPGNKTCATDGLCAENCPVKIDTGKLIKELRLEEIGKSANTAAWIADHMSFVTSAGRIGLSAVSIFHSIFGTAVMKVITGGLRWLSFNKIPFWNPFLPGGASRIRQKVVSTPKRLAVVYFPSCINRTMGRSKDYDGEKQLTDKMIDLLHKAGYEVIFPENLDNLCCGMAFLSKGYKEAGERKSRELEDALSRASRNGEYPVLCDMSPCLFTMKENFKSGLKLYEPVEFITDCLLPHLQIIPIDEVVTVFPVCSLKKMGLEKSLVDLARKCVNRVIVPESSCCGFAGDRGFTYQELNKHGLRNLKKQIPGEVIHGYSTSRTCEIGLSYHSGVSYKSIVYLVDKVSAPKAG